MVQIGRRGTQESLVQNQSIQQGYITSIEVSLSLVYREVAEVISLVQRGSRVITGIGITCIELEVAEIYHQYKGITITGIERQHRFRGITAWYSGTTGISVQQRYVYRQQCRWQYPAIPVYTSDSNKLSSKPLSAVSSKPSSSITKKAALVQVQLHSGMYFDLMAYD